MNNNYNKYKCNFIKQYKEPVEKYNIFSFSIFYMKKYTRHYKDFSKNISIKRQNQFLYNLILNINNLENGFFGNNWYFRIYYDKSLFEFNIGNKYPWKDFYNTYKNNRLIQFVQFRCDHFINSKSDSHINLFGTFARLHPIFEKNDLLETVCVFDADNFITKKYFDEIMIFKKSNFDYNSFCSSYETSYYKNNNRKDPDNCYIRCGMLAVNKKLPENLWNFILYQLKTYQDKEFEKLIEKLFIYHSKLLPDKKIKTYKEFEYGMDEIILNYYIKQFFIDNKFKMRVVRYKPMLMAIINTIIAHLNSNYKQNKLIIDNFLKNMLKNKFTNNIKTDLNNFNLMFYEKINVKYVYNDVKDILLELRNNFNIIKNLDFPSVVRYFIDNFSSNDFNELEPFNSFFISINKPFFI